MLILLLISLEIHVSPNPIEGKVGDNIPINVVVLDEEGKPLEAKIDFRVIPHELGDFRDNIFIPRKRGRGILRCISFLDGKKINGYAYIKISDNRSISINPAIAIMEVGESKQFSVTTDRVVKWKVIPDDIGRIENGFFKALKPGKGRVVAVTDDKRVISALIRIKGAIKTLKIIPGFKNLKVGDRTTFTTKEDIEVEWDVKPAGIGKIDENGTFTAESPGRAQIIAKTKYRDKIKTGNAIVVIAGKLKLRIIPENVTINTGERIQFKIEINDNINTKNIPIRWKVIPRGLGLIKSDGTLIAGNLPMKGRVVGLIPERFGGGIASSRVSVISRLHKNLEINPRFKTLNVGDEFTFEIKNKYKFDIPIRWKVFPENLGTITNNGKFKALRTGSGVIIADPSYFLNLNPGKALIVVGENANITISVPSHTVLEYFTIPILIKSDIKDYRVFWVVKPEYSGWVTKRGVFHARKLKEGKNQQNVTIYAVFYRDRQILGWGSVNLVVKKLGE